MPEGSKEFQEGYQAGLKYGIEGRNKNPYDITQPEKKHDFHYGAVKGSNDLATRNNYKNSTHFQNGCDRARQEIENKLSGKFVNSEDPPYYWDGSPIIDRIEGGGYKLFTSKGKNKYGVYAGGNGRLVSPYPLDSAQEAKSWAEIRAGLRMK